MIYLVVTDNSNSIPQYYELIGISYKNTKEELNAYRVSLSVIVENWKLSLRELEQQNLSGQGLRFPRD